MAYVLHIILAPHVATEKVGRRKPLLSLKHLPATSYNLLITGAMCALLFLAFSVYVYSEKQIDRANEQRQLSYQLAYQLRHSSDELTRMARSYVVTHNPPFKRHFQDILDIRDGKLARPENYFFAYWDQVLMNPEPLVNTTGEETPLLDLMRQAGFTDQEMSKLEEAKTLSDKLGSLELTAMQLADSTESSAETDRAEAIRMLHDQNYHEVKASIMGLIDAASVMVDARTLNVVNRTAYIAFLFRLMFITVTFAALGLLFVAYRRLHRTLGTSADEVQAHIARIGSNVLTSPIEIPPGMENSVLAGLAGMHAKLYAGELARSEAQEKLKILNEGLEARVRQRTRQMALARDDAERANQAKTRFLASMSHELRTPLNAVLGFSQLLVTDKNLPETYKECAQEIYKAGKLLLGLVNEILDLSRIEANQMQLTLQTVKVNSMTGACFSVVAELARDAGVNLIDDASEHGGITIMADQQRLQQVMLNLLSNAIKYNSRGGNVRLSYELPEDATQSSVRIMVSDNGPGIPAHLQTRLFTAFDRLGMESGNIEGTGIGLLISKRIAEAMGGTVGFSSTEGQGSSFWVEFPIAGSTGATLI